MAISLTHTTQATGTDAGNGEIRKAQWNEAHTLTMATNRLLGRTTAGTGAVEEISVAGSLSLSGGVLTGSGKTLITSWDWSTNVSSVDFADNASFASYKDIEVRLIRVTLGTAGESLRVRVGIDASTGLRTSSYVSSVIQASGTTLAAAVVNSAFHAGIAPATSTLLSGSVVLKNLSSATVRTTAEIKVAGVNTGATAANGGAQVGAGHYDTAEAQDTIRVLATNGNITGGRIEIWGIA